MSGEDLVAPIAARHNDPVVRAFAEQFLPLFFARRRQLRAPYHDADGNLLLPAFPEFLRVPAKRGSDEARPDLDFRRSDHMRAFCRVWSVVYAHTDWHKKEIREPNPAAHGGHVYLSVERIAELAQIPVWQTERCLYWLRAARVITHTVQFREELPDGSHRSNDAALRRISLWPLDRTPCTRTPLRYRQRKLGERADKQARRAARQGIAADIVRQREEQDAAPATPSRPPAPRPASLPPAELVAQVGEEHPHWSLSDCQDEARRRQREQKG